MRSNIMNLEDYKEMCEDICRLYLSGLGDNDVLKFIKEKFHLTRKDAKLYLSQWFTVENSLK